MKNEKLRDRYCKLRPWTDIESCECEVVTGLVLVNLLTDNPIHCATCKNEVDPERLGLSGEEVEAVAGWHQVNHSLEELWLDSGEYEEYAKDKLLDLSSQVNRDGLKAAKMLSVHFPTLVWLFRDSDDDLIEDEVVDCPICLKPLNKNVKYGIGRCLGCHIML